jgi:hypothetical protein
MKALLVRREAWLVAGLFLLGYTILFLAIYLSLAAGGAPDAYQLAWWHLRVPALDRTFGDLRTITHGVECMERGIDPYIVNPCDPWWRPVNYPPIWLKLFELAGVGPGITRALGVVIDVTFVAAAMAFLGNRPNWQGLVYGIALISPAVMMGIERGNNDYLMFALVVAGLFLSLSGQVARRAAGSAFLVAAVILKLFPVFSAAMVLIRRRSLLLPAITVALAGAIYFIAGRDMLEAAARNTHREVFYSYGAAVLFAGLEKYFSIAAASAWTWPTLAGVSGLALLLGFGVRESFVLRDDRWGAGFAVAGAIYLFSFCVASSFDYRLAFLLLSLPQLTDWAAGRERRTERTLARLAIASILLTLWLSFYSVKLHLIDEGFAWLAYLLLLAMMTANGLRFLAWLMQSKPATAGT